jgi:hypothetical protein
MFSGSNESIRKRIEAVESGNTIGLKYYPILRAVAEAI